MAGKIIMCVVSFGCAILFFAIGVYAKKLEKPMWFWSGIPVDAATISDVKQYNKENGTMWQLYSGWFFAAGLAEFWNTFAAAILLILSCTVGLPLLIVTYHRIYRKYRAQ